MIYKVRVWDEATYEIEADNVDEALMRADEQFSWRIFATEILDVREG